jgi:arginine decarboxylase
MNNTYFDLVKQTFNFPQEGFDVYDNYLQFNGLDLQDLIAKYGTPMKLTYLPKIGMQIKKAKQMFANAFKKHRYEGEYYYCYCTKSSHFSFVLEEALKHDIHLKLLMPMISRSSKSYTKRKDQ